MRCVCVNNIITFTETPVFRVLHSHFNRRSYILKHSLSVYVEKDVEISYTAEIGFPSTGSDYSFTKLEDDSTGTIDRIKDQNIQ